MLRPAVVVAALCELLPACGGRTPLDNLDDAGDETDGSGAAEGSWASQGPCATSEGVRVCGGNGSCPWLTPPQCVGFGCTPALSIDAAHAEAGAGVCWSDLSDEGARPCNACDDGEVCVYRHPDDLICAPADLCHLLWQIGATSVCRYADKSPFDDTPLPEATSSCPGGLAGKGILCGGDCGRCSLEPDLRRCVGRSPGRPYGLCPGTGPVKGEIAMCGPTAPACPTNLSCASFQLASLADEAVAKRYGICIARDLCHEAAAAVGGAVVCNP